MSDVTLRKFLLLNCFSINPKIANLKKKIEKAKKGTSTVCKSSFLLANSGMTLGRERGLEVGRLEFSWRKAAAGEGDWGQTAVVGNA